MAAGHAGRPARRARDQPPAPVGGHAGARAAAERLGRPANRLAANRPEASVPLATPSPNRNNSLPTSPPLPPTSPQFLTNVFFPIYLAQRLRPDTPEEEAAAAAARGQPALLPSFAPAVGALAAAVGAFSVGWALAARPEYGGLAERWEYLSTLLATSRVDWAFAVDSGLYAGR